MSDLSTKPPADGRTGVPPAAPASPAEPAPPAVPPGAAGTPPGEGRDRQSIAVFASLAALFLAVVGIGFGLRAVDEADDAEDATAAAAEGAPATTSVSLKEFSITPAALEIATGGTVELRNDGQVEHDFAVDGTDLKSALVPPGATASLALGDLAPGEYTVRCTVAGHAEAGMTGTLRVVAGGAAGTGTGAGTSGAGAAPGLSADEMDASAMARAAAFPAETEGRGGTILEPTVVDGVKQFDLTATVVQWEVEPGRTVEAWAYNGTVPGPTLKVARGDTIRVNVRNELPESTSIHFHGVRTPHELDGVPGISQEPVKPGASFTYEFVANGPAVGMYHSHHDAQIQVPDGLTGTILIGQLPLPAGVSVSQEVPFFLNDGGNIGFSINGKAFPATEPVVARLGEKVLVHYLNEGLTAHPMHLHGPPQLVVARDGFPLPQPYYLDTVNVAPGERWSVVVEADQVGAWAWHCHILTHAEKPEGLYGMTTAFVVQ